MFKVEAAAIAALGYAVFPCANPLTDTAEVGKKGKRPLTAHGSLDATTDLQQIEKWAAQFPDANIGIRCQNCLVLDVDNKDGKNGSDDVKNISAELGRLTATSIARTGTGGFHLFFAKPAACTVATTGVLWNGKKTGIDIRCNNAYIVAPPSLHENGIFYKWLQPLVSPEKLAPLPQLWIEDFLPSQKIRTPLVAPPVPAGNYAVDCCQKYVDTIEPLQQGNRNNGIFRIAAIIFWDFGLSESEGFPILQYFNARCLPPLTEAEITRAMKRVFELGGEKERGWRQHAVASQQPPSRFAAVGESQVDISALLTPKLVITEPKTIKLPEPLPARLIHVPGFIEQVSRFTLSAAPQAQPTMALVGALAAQSVLTARKVCSADTFRPSLYLLALAETGTGKDYPRAVNQHILESVGMGSYVPEKCASGEGLEDAIISKGMLLLQTDEINFTFSNMALKNESRWSKLESVILELYSCTHKSYTGRLKANMCGKAIDPPKVFEPGLSIFGTATPSRFCGALTFEMIEGGLASRCIVLECEPRKYTQRQRELSSMPPDIIEIAQHWADFVPVHPVTGKPGNISGTTCAPQRLIIPFTPQSDERMLDFRKYCDEQIMSLSKQKQPIEAALWTRVYENAGRLAVNYACSKNHLQPIIDTDTVIWASDFAIWTAENMIRMVRQNVAENPFHAMSLRIQSLIRKNGGKILHSKLMKSSHISSKQLKDVLDTLLEAGTLARNFTDTGGRPTCEYVLLE